MPLFDSQVCPETTHSFQDSGMLGLGEKRKLEEVADDAIDAGHGAQLTCKRHCKEVCPNPEEDNCIMLTPGYQHHVTPCPSHGHEPRHHVTLCAAHEYGPQHHMPSLPCPAPPAPPCPHALSMEGEEDIHGCMKDVALSNNIPTPTPVNNLFTHPASGLLQTHGAEQQCVMWMDMDGETYCPMLGKVDMQSGVMSMQQSGVMNMPSGVMNVQSDVLDIQSDIVNMQSQFVT